MTESPKELIVSSFSSECGIVILSECILIFRPEGLSGIIKPSPVKKGYFLTVKRQIYSITLTVQKFQCISNLTIWADFHGLLAPEDWISRVKLENQFLCQFSKTDSF